MLFLFYFYVMMNPLEYLQEKIPKGATGMNYQNIMLLAMLLWWLFRGGPNGRHKLLPGRLNIMLLGLLAWTLMGLVQTTLTVPGAYPVFDIFGPTFTFFLRLANGFIFFWLAANMVDSRRKIRWCLWAIGFSMPLVWRAFRSDVGMHSTAAYSDVLRFSGPFVYLGSNELAALFVIGFLFFAFFTWGQRALWEKAAYAVAAGMYGYGVLYSYSRGAQLSVIAVCVIAAAIRYRWVLALIAIAVLTQDAWVPDSVRERWEMTEDENGQLEESAASRERFWNLAIDLFIQNPVTGHGVLSFKILNPEKMDTHNIYMRIICEQGLVGLFFFFGIWWQVLKMSFQLWRRARNPYDRQFGFALMMTTIGLMFANFFGDRFSHLSMIGQYWVIVGLGFRLHAAMMGVEPLLGEAPALDDAQVEDEAPHGTPGIAPGIPAQPKILAILAPATMTNERPAKPDLWILHASMESSAPSPPAPSPEPKPMGPHPSRALNIVGRRPLQAPPGGEA